MQHAKMRWRPRLSRDPVSETYNVPSYPLAVGEEYSASIPRTPTSSSGLQVDSFGLSVNQSINGMPTRLSSMGDSINETLIIRYRTNSASVLRVRSIQSSNRCFLLRLAVVTGMRPSITYFSRAVRRNIMTDVFQLLIFNRARSAHFYLSIIESYTI